MKNSVMFGSSLDKFATFENLLYIEYLISLNLLIFFGSRRLSTLTCEALQDLSVYDFRTWSIASPMQASFLPLVDLASFFQLFLGLGSHIQLRQKLVLFKLSKLSNKKRKHLPRLSAGFSAGSWPKRAFATARVKASA